MPQRIRLASALLLVATIVAVPLMAQQGALRQVTFQDLLDGFEDTSRWLMYSGDYTGRRHSPLKQITPENLHLLTAQWTFQAEVMPAGRGFEVTPLMLDGILYIAGNNDLAWAMDPRTGRVCAPVDAGFSRCAPRRGTRLAVYLKTLFDDADQKL